MDEQEWCELLSQYARDVARLDELIEAQKKELAPFEQRIAGLKDEIISTYEYWKDENGRKHITGFRGQRRRVLSHRIVAVRWRGDWPMYCYDDVPVDVVLRDADMVDLRKALFAEQMNLIEVSGKPREHLRELKADRQGYVDAMERLRTMPDDGRKKPKTEGNGPDHGTDADLFSWKKGDDGSK